MFHLFLMLFSPAHPALDRKMPLHQQLQHNPDSFHPLFLLTRIAPVPTSHHCQYTFLYLPDYGKKGGNSNLCCSSLHTLSALARQLGQTHLLVDPDGRIYAHHSMSFHAHAAGLRVHLTFHTGALCQVPQSAPVNYDSCTIDFYKPSYDVDSSSDVVLNLRYPFP